MEAENIDLGDGYYAHWVGWAPDRDLNPQYQGIPDEPRWALLIGHPRADGPDQSHESMVTVDGPVQRQVNPDAPRWELVSTDPLELSPSVLCVPDMGGCGRHGFVRGGRWVDA